MLKTQSFSALSRALFFCGPNPFHGSGNQRTLGSLRQISSVRSSLPESTTITSSANGIDARQSPIFLSSFLVMTMAVIFMEPFLRPTRHPIPR